MITLKNGAMTVMLDPRHGGQTVSAQYDGKQVLRNTEALQQRDVLSSASFPLVPFSNRLLNGQMRFQDRLYKLPSNWENDCHAIHGKGWQDAWQTIAQDDHQATFEHQSRAWWPWRYTAQLTTRVFENGISQALALKNEDAEPFPAGLGFHPYFPLTEQTRLAFSARSIQAPIIADIPPFEPVGRAVDFAQGPIIRGRMLDHCFQGWRGPAYITQPDQGLVLEVTASDYQNWCVVYIPQGESFFCFEPVSHANGAFNQEDISGSGLQILEPGQSLHFSMTIKIV